MSAGKKATTYAIKGFCQWAKLRLENMDRKFGDVFKIDVELDDKNLRVFKASGSRWKLRKDEGTGKLFVSMKRNNVGAFPEASGPPLVLDNVNKEFLENIGNGSLVTAFFVTYPSKYGTGSRLEKVVIHDLVEYEGGDEVIDADNINDQLNDELPI